MDIKSAQYTGSDKEETTRITAVIDGETMSIPILEGNRHYDEIMKQVKAGTLTIKDAD